MKQVNLKECIPMWLDGDTILLTLDEEIGNNVEDLNREWLNIELWTDDNDSLHIVWCSETEVYPFNKSDLLAFGLDEEQLRQYLIDFKNKP